MSTNETHKSDTRKAEGFIGL